MRKIIFVLVFTLISFFYLYRLGDIPNGIFCDEAEIGVQSNRLAHGDWTVISNGILYKHFGYEFGALPVYSTAPFVKIYGLSEFSIRFASVFFLLLSLLAVFASLRMITSFFGALIGMINFALTPLVFHLSRAAFGQTCSFFLITGAIYFFIIFYKQQNKSWRPLFLSATLLGISTYGYSGFIAAGALTAITLSLTIILFTKHRRVIMTLFFSLVFLLTISPFFFNYLVNPAFSKRFAEKTRDKTPLYSLTRLKEIIRSYPKYYALDYLIIKGEANSVARHSVPGAGILLKTTFLLIIWGLIICIYRLRNNGVFLPFFLLLLFYPAVDIFFSKPEWPPYSIAVYTVLFIVPFITAHAVTRIGKKIFPTLIIVLIFCEFGFFFKNYLKYPEYSSDYWGWQAGAREIIAYFKSQQPNYDELYITGYFNEAPVFLEFYDPEKKCKKCFTGGNDRLDFDKRQLFAFRIVEQDNWSVKLKQSFVPVKYIYLPDKRAEFVIGVFKLRYN